MPESANRSQDVLNSVRSVLHTANIVRKNLLRLYRRQKWRLPHLILFPIVFLYYEILLRLFGTTPVFRTFLYPLLFSMAAGFFWSGITSIFPKKVNRRISMVVLYGCAVIFITECLIRDSYQVYMTLSSIKSGAKGVAGDFTKDLLRAIFHGIPKMFMFFLPAILYTGTGKRRMPARRYPLAFAGILIVFALLIQGVAVLSATHGKNSGKYKGQYDFNTATQTFGLSTSIRLDLKYALFGGARSNNFVLDTEPEATQDAEDSTEESAVEAAAPVNYGDNVMDIDFDALNSSTDSDTLLSMNQYVSSLTPSKQNAYTGLFAGKNLILICAEAFSDVVVSEELTPTLYRLVHNGFYFSDFYQPTWGGSTSTGEYSFLMGLVPVDAVDSMLKTQDNNNYLTMGSQLQRLGYYSAAFHNGNYNFYDRDLTHENLGYDRYLGIGNGLEDILVDRSTDEAMFDATMDTYLSEQPFSIYYMTIDGHCTYDSGTYNVDKYMNRVRSVLGSRYKERTLNYFCYQMGLEAALTLMIEKLEAAGIADDTVICLTADHYPYGLENTATFGNDEDYVSDLYGYTYENAWEQDHNSLVIWSGCLENEKKDMVQEISTPTYSLDILPTLSNLFGVEYDSRLLVGRDVFSDTDPLVLWTDYSWVTERGKYDSIASKYYPNEGYTDDQSYVDRINQIVANKISYSGKAVDEDYFGYIFGKKES